MLGFSTIKLLISSIPYFTLWKEVNYARPLLKEWEIMPYLLKSFIINMGYLEFFHIGEFSFSLTYLVNHLLYPYRFVDGYFISCILIQYCFIYSVAQTVPALTPSEALSVCSYVSLTNSIILLFSGTTQCSIQAHIF